MIAVDSSVIIAAFASWHEGNRSAAAILARKPRVPGHVLIETYSVLKRLPPPHRAPSLVVAAFLVQLVRDAPLTLAGGNWARMLLLAGEAGITGSATYDALIGAAANQAGATLLTRDRRATAVYQKLGFSYELVLGTPMREFRMRPRG